MKRIQETAMQIGLRQANISLAAHRALTLTDAAGAEVECVTGQLWLTMDGDRRDIFLAPGDAHNIERGGLTLINAIEPSVMHVELPRARPAAWKRRLTSAWDWLVGAAEARVRARIERGIYHV
jgi:hypothetical protein